MVEHSPQHLIKKRDRLFTFVKPLLFGSRMRRHGCIEHFVCGVQSSSEKSTIYLLQVYRAMTNKSMLKESIRHYCGLRWERFCSSDFPLLSLATITRKALFITVSCVMSAGEGE